MDAAPDGSHELPADREADPLASATSPLRAIVSNPVQRRCEGCDERVTQDAPGMVNDALRSPGEPLDAPTRAFFEPRFGRDFSEVRIHADDRAARSAQSIGASAYAAGSHIVFGSGQYAPSSSGGRRMLAHELTHIVQQRAGRVDGAAGPDGLSISDPDDRFERAADATADEVMSAAPGAAPISSAPTSAIPSRASPGVVQRFLAGEAGHGGIEEGALVEAGFSEDEAHATYFGNWLRDFSQLFDVDKPTGGARLTVTKLLALGEFGHELTTEEIGQYLPSEHVDNPEGGKSAEATGISDDVRALRRSHLSASQRVWFDKEQDAHFKQTIHDASKATGLPEYIERAKAHVRLQLDAAARKGRNREGERELGNGLHAVEDYFAHSNFIEVALAKLAKEGALSQANPLVRAFHRYYKVRPDLQPADRFGRPGIITGTSAPGPGDEVGKWEAIKAELENAEIRKALMRGAVIRYGWQKPAAAGRTALGAVGGVVGAGVGGAVGAVAGLGSGAGHGAAEGWRSAHHWWSKPFAAVGGLFKGAVVGAGHGAVSGAKTGWRVGEKAGGAVGEIAGGVVGVAAVAPLFFTLHLLVAAGLAAAKSRLEKKARRKIQENTRKTVNPTLANQPPTHSQIAKDDIEHPLHAAAAQLARDADVSFGRMMIEVWAGRRSISDAQRLVDDFLVHPYENEAWWKPILLKAAAPAPAASDKAHERGHAVQRSRAPAQAAPGQLRQGMTGRPAEVPARGEAVTPAAARHTIQRSATWKGAAVHETLSPAEIIAGGQGLPNTLQMLNGHTLLAETDADAAIKRPGVATASKPGAGSAAAPSWTAKVDTVPAQEGSADETVLGPGPWSKIITKAQAGAITRIAACAGPGRSVFTVHGKASPSDRVYSGDVALYQANRRHEDHHVADHEVAFDATIGTWDRKVQEAKDKGTEFSGVSAGAATGTLWAAIGPPQKAARDYRKLANDKGDAFHNTAAGGMMVRSNPTASPDCSASGNDVTNPS